MALVGSRPLNLWELTAFVFTGSLVALLSGSLRMANDAIREREAQLKFTAAAMPEILFVADSSGRIETLSERFRDYSGQDPSGLSFFDPMDLVHPEDRLPTLKAWTVSVRDKTEFHSTGRLRAKDGNYQWFQFRAAPMCDTEQLRGSRSRQVTIYRSR
jgi:PAS domain S-box-containing protein